MSRGPFLNQHDDALLTECEVVLEYRFADRSLLECALTHASIARTRIESNERLEFLGDAILGAVVCEQLYHDFPDATEGEMTRIKSVVVSRATCEEISHAIALNRFMLLGRGVDTRGRLPGSILAAVFESIVGAIYLDSGYDAAKTFILRHVAEFIHEASESNTGVNYKSLLQQYAQRTLGATPTYTVLDEQGPDHLKCFQVGAKIGDDTYPAAWGPNKKEAEQRAACNAMASLEGEELPFTDDGSVTN